MITVEAKTGAVSTYKKLLLCDWTNSFPKDVLALLWATIDRRKSTNEDDGLWQVLNSNETGPFPSEFFQSIIARIADGTRFVRLADLPKMTAEDFPSKKVSGLVAQVNRLATYLTLAAHASVAGDIDFFADVQALAFQAAIHVVLPALRGKHQAEHSLLLHSAVLFTIGYSAYQPEHYAYMMSMVHDYLGNKEERLRTLFASFRFTAPQDHSYLTKAQECWMELLDQDKPDEAEDFLLSLHQSSLPGQHDEIREMVVDALKYIMTKPRVASHR